MKYQYRDDRSLGRKLTHQVEIQIIGRPLGVTRIAKELRRQERNSDFTGYTENFTFLDLQHFLRSVGGPQWELSIVPISLIKCWHASAPVKEICCGVKSDEERFLLDRQIQQLVEKIREGRTLPGIFLTKSQNRRNTHWILDGHRRLLAHRLAKAPTILVYHPFGMFSGNTTGRIRFA